MKYAIVDMTKKDGIACDSFFENQGEAINWANANGIKYPALFECPDEVSIEDAKKELERKKLTLKTKIKNHIHTKILREIAILVVGFAIGFILGGLL